MCEQSMNSRYNHEEPRKLYLVVNSMRHVTIIWITVIFIFIIITIVIIMTVIITVIYSNNNDNNDYQLIICLYIIFHSAISFYYTAQNSLNSTKTKAHSHQQFKK